MIDLVKKENIKECVVIIVVIVFVLLSIFVGVTWLNKNFEEQKALGDYFKKLDKELPE